MAAAQEEPYLSDVVPSSECQVEVVLADGRRRLACQTSDQRLPEEVVAESNPRSRLVLHQAVLLVVPSPTPCASSPSPGRRSQASDVGVAGQ